MGVEFEMLIKELPLLMEQLEISPSRLRTELGKLPQKGIYVFYECEQPIYVGRTNRLKSRILEHGWGGSGHNSAPFAFNLAKKVAKENGIDVKAQRNNLERDPSFQRLFHESKIRVAHMSIKFVEVSDPVLQTIFEVYASLHLGTSEYNSFDNH